MRRTYILAGLEPVGHIPQISQRTVASLGNLRSSMASSISLSFFITKNMKNQLRETALSGTLPILMVYAARAGKTVTDVSLITLDPDGNVTPVTPGSPQRGVQGAKIVFGGAGKPEQTLYYFSTDISDGGLKTSGFLKFAETFGPGDAMFKAASYLPHSGGFSQIRDFVLEQGEQYRAGRFRHPGALLQARPMDLPSVRPLSRTDRDFPRPPSESARRNLHRKGPFKPLDFGMGYRWRPNESNVLWATRKDLAPDQLRPAIVPLPISAPAGRAEPARRSKLWQQVPRRAGR